MKQHRRLVWGEKIEAVLLPRIQRPFFEYLMQTDRCSLQWNKLDWSPVAQLEKAVISSHTCRASLRSSFPSRQNCDVWIGTPGPYPLLRSSVHMCMHTQQNPEIKTGITWNLIKCAFGKLLNWETLLLYLLLQDNATTSLISWNGSFDKMLTIGFKRYILKYYLILLCFHFLHESTTVCSSRWFYKLFHP